MNERAQEGDPAARRPGEIRAMDAGDLERVYALRTGADEHPLTDDYVTFTRFAAPFVAQGCEWVFEAEDGEILGEVGVDPSVESVEALYVDGAARRCGIGAALLAHACADLAGRGCSVARFACAPGSAAHALARRAGFEPVNELRPGEMVFERRL